MKKLLFLSITILFVTKLSAQSITWCPSGALWYFKYQNFYQLGTNGYVELKYTGDTTISSIVCKKIVGKFSGCEYCNKDNLSVYPSVVIPNFRTYYSYENNGVIYLYNINSSKFDTVVNFNASIGDKWQRPGGCGDILTVTDTGHVSSYGLYLKQIKTSHTYTFVQYAQPFDTTSTSTIITSDNGNIFTEYVFSTSAVPFDELFGTSCYEYQPTGVVDEEPEQTATFLCYQDNISNFNGCAQYFTGIEKMTDNKINFSVYPNPTNEIENIELEMKNENAEIKIVDLLGKTVIHNSSLTNHNLIDVSEIKSGIYFLQVFENGNLLGVQKLVKE